MNTEALAVEFIATFAIVSIGAGAIAPSRPSGGASGWVSPVFGACAAMRASKHLCKQL